jgi:site-specific recombinase XerD
MKMNTKPKEPVKIRLKELKDGNKSVYLDIYHNGKRQYRFLKLYIVPERTPLDKLQNQNVMVLANKAKSETIIELTNGRFGVVKETNKTVSDLLDIYTAYNVNNCRNKQSFVGNVHSAKKHIADTGLLERKAATITEKDIVDFVLYLKDRGLKDSTIKGYKIILGACFRYATNKGLIKQNPFDRVEKLPLKKPKRQLPVYLEKSELERLENTKHEQAKQTKDVANAFLFSCYTGLRLSDVVNLKPEHIKTERSGRRYISLTTSKTQQPVKFPLPQKALQYMQSHFTKTDGHIFKLPSKISINKYLKRWGAAADIDKNLHFHIARHTFATLAISAGVPVEVVRDLLGHSDIATTLIYAEVTKEKKQQEIDRLNEYLK